MSEETKECDHSYGLCFDYEGEHAQMWRCEHCGHERPDPPYEQTKGQHEATPEERVERVKRRRRQLAVERASMMRSIERLMEKLANDAPREIPAFYKDIAKIISEYVCTRANKSPFSDENLRKVFQEIQEIQEDQEARKTLEERVERLEREAGFPSVSMGCRVPRPVCGVCGEEIKNGESK